MPCLFTRSLHFLYTAKFLALYVAVLSVQTSLLAQKIGDEISTPALKVSVGKRYKIGVGVSEKRIGNYSTRNSKL